MILCNFGYVLLKQFLLCMVDVLVTFNNMQESVSMLWHIQWNPAPLNGGHLQYNGHF